MSDLEDVIVSSIEDASTEPEPVETVDSDTLDTAAEVPDTTETEVVAAPDAAVPETEVSSKTQVDTSKTDDFEKKYGIPPTSSAGRENRIPYSRVQKIVARQAKEIEATYTPRITEYETKVKDYETRLTDVAKFEQIMANEPEKFVQMLKTLPAYQDYFTKLQAVPAPTEAEPTAPVDPDADMPQPNTTLSDGSKVYDEVGLKALNAWNRAKARQETLEEVNKVYGPIQEQWQAQERLRKAMPKIQAQISEAKKWPLFSENELDIAKALNADPNLSLERAYQQIVYPKLVSSKDAMRAELLKELKRAPTSTSAPAGGVKPVIAKAGNQSLEEIIAEQVNLMKGA